jgi:16S rRNA processing protein RimM
MQLVLVGRVRKAFGLKGELLVQPATSEPGVLFAPGRRVFVTVEFADQGSTSRDSSEPRSCIIEASRPFKEAWLVKLAGVSDKTDADKWRGVQLMVPFEELTPPAGNEVYEHELVGMLVRDEPHGELGVVDGWYEVPQGLVLEVRGAAWRVDVPFNEAFVEQVDRDARTISVRLPDGLLEKNDQPAS